MLILEKERDQQFPFLSFTVKMHWVHKLLILISVLTLQSCKDDDAEQTPAEHMQLTALRVGTVSLLGEEVNDAPTDQPIVMSFSVPLDTGTVPQNVLLETAEGVPLDLSFAYPDAYKTISATPKAGLTQNTHYTITIGEGIQGIQDRTFSGVEYNFTTYNPPLEVLKLTIDGVEPNQTGRIQNIDFTPEIEIHFSEPITVSDITGNVFITSTGNTIIPEIMEIRDSVMLFSLGDNVLDYYGKYRFYLSSGISYAAKDFDGYELHFYTKLDSTLKFPEITDDELLTKIQAQTFGYFWDFGHPTSGLARERNTSGNTVTIGGSGFGLMAILVGIERGFITRTEGITRIETIVNFLKNDADRFHGVWSHWLNGNTGDVIPFSSNDDGGDLVETAFMIQGLLTVRQYLDDTNPQEQAIIDNINILWNEVEWDWYRQNNQNVLYWHWSPNFGWEKNHQIKGWNEALIVYVLAASSPTHPINVDVYTEGWANSGGIVNGNSYYDITLPLGSPRGGPLFFSHYSFLGLDPRNLEDQYANYWTQNVAHSLINHAYCLDNPLSYIGYSSVSWGLTASDNHDGYSAHSPTNDLGVITPTAAISSLPYTPQESLNAIRHFYYILGDKLWGDYGFYDAFNVTEGWYASSYLAIDQGPIICMIENYRTGLLWDLFMSAPEVQNGLTTLGFTY